MKRGLLSSLAVLLAVGAIPVYASLTCSVATTCPTGVVIYRMSSTTSAHAELPSQSNYTQLVCCSGVAGLSNTCSGAFSIALKLSSTTNAHTELNSQSNYTQNACISVPSGGTTTIGYQASNCNGYDATLGSISATTNSHVGSSTAYTTRICANASQGQSLSFSLSASSISFGTLSPVAARYASSTASGDSSEVEAHSFTVSSNAPSGYIVTVSGASLTSGAYTIAEIGGANTASSVGSEQFGMRLMATGGSGVVTAPYAASGFAYNATSSPVQVANATTGDGVSTIFSARYIANISAITRTNTYSTSLTYTVTSTY